MRTGRVVAVVLIAGGILFGAMGGEFSTLDWWKLERQVEAERDTMAGLSSEIDSLAAYADSIETDRTTQERVARERFGMIRNGEMLYRVEPVER